MLRALVALIGAVVIVCGVLGVLRGVREAFVVEAIGEVSGLPDFEGEERLVIFSEGGAVFNHPTQDRVLKFVLLDEAKKFSFRFFDEFVPRRASQNGPIRPFLAVTPFPEETRDYAGRFADVCYADVNRCALAHKIYLFNKYAEPRSLQSNEGVIGILRSFSSFARGIPRLPNQPNANYAEEDPGYGSLSHALGPFRHLPLSTQIFAVIVGLILGAYGHVVCWRRSDPGSAKGWIWAFAGIGCGVLGCVLLIVYLS